MTDWNIQSRAHACQACSATFVDKQPYHTLLFDERQGYQRVDVCEACWAAQYSQGASDRKGFISHWQGVYAAPPVGEPEPIKKETAETLLRKLVEKQEPEHAAACYILAVMLERKRLLKVQSQLKQDGRRVFVYEQPKTGDLFTIPDPDLQLDQLEAVQRDVAHLLEHGLETPAPETAAPTPEAAAAEETDVPVTEAAAAEETAVTEITPEVQPAEGETAKV